MSQSARVARWTALLSAALPVLLALTWSLSQRHRLPTMDKPCDLQNWGCSTTTSLIGTLLLFGVPVVFPLLTIYVQHRLIWRSRTVLTVPQIVASLAPAPLILSLAAAVVGVRGDGELAVMAFLFCVPTTVVAALQQMLIRRRLLRQGAQRPASSAAGTPLVHLFLGSYALLLLIGTVLTWGPEGKSWQQLLPRIVLLLLFLTLCAGVYTTFALYFVIRSLTSPTPLGRVARVLCALTGLIGVAAIGGWGLLTALLQDPVVEEVTADGSTYLGTKGDYPPTCYHLYKGGPLMKRDCVLAEELGLATAEAQLPNDLTDQSSPGVQSPQSGPETTDTPVSPDADLPQVVVASRGSFGVLQIGASLGQKGTYAFAQRSDGSWVPGTTIVEDATFTDFVKVHSLLLAAFAPDPDFSIMVSGDDGRTWQPADLDWTTVPEDMRYFHGLTYTDGIFTLTTGYPSWVDSHQVDQWTSNDGVAWESLNP